MLSSFEALSLVFAAFREERAAVYGDLRRLYEGYGGGRVGGSGYSGSGGSGSG
jgi:hypothetical protein